MILYMGNDYARSWKDNINYETKGEQAIVKRFCNRLNSYIGEIISFGKFSLQEETEGLWHVIELNHRKGSKIRTTILAFLRVDARLLLADIE